MNGLSDLMAVALGGSLGASLRHLITLAATSLAGVHAAVGTTVANLLGCLAIGFLIVLSGESVPSWFSPRMTLFARVGLIGSLTTFSTFIAETVTLTGQSRWTAAAVYVSINLVLGTICLLVAIRMGRAMMGAG